MIFFYLFLQKACNVLASFINKFISQHFFINSSILGKCFLPLPPSWYVVGYRKLPSFLRTRVLQPLPLFCGTDRRRRRDKIQIHIYLPFHTIQSCPKCGVPQENEINLIVVVLLISTTTTTVAFAKWMETNCLGSVWLAHNPEDSEYADHRDGWIGWSGQRPWGWVRSNVEAVEWVRQAEIEMVRSLECAEGRIWVCSVCEQ